MAQLGSALDWGSRGRWFESSRSDHFLIINISVLEENRGALSSAIFVGDNTYDNRIGAKELPSTWQNLLQADLRIMGFILNFKWGHGCLRRC